MHHGARGSLTTSALRRFQLATSFNKDITGWSTAALEYGSNMFALLPSHLTAPRLRLSFHPRFDGATAWLDAYTRDPASSTNDGPPSSWSNTINADLKAAVVACVGQSAAGNCACAGTSCSSNPRLTGPIGTWDVSGVTSMYILFYTSPSGACTIFCNFNGDISGWDTSSVKAMYIAFAGTTSFNGDISAWDTSSVTTMRSMFYKASGFNRAISRWDTSSVTNMAQM